jgi:hypothetical protein
MAADLATCASVTASATSSSVGRESAGKKERPDKRKAGHPKASRSPVQNKGQERSLAAELPANTTDCDQAKTHQQERCRFRYN